MRTSLSFFRPLELTHIQKLGISCPVILVIRGQGMLTSMRVLTSTAIGMHLCLLAMMRIRHVTVVKVTVRHFWEIHFLASFPRDNRYESQICAMKTKLKQRGELA